MAPVDMRYFAARDGRPADYCRQRVRECEIYIAIVGFRYGSLVPGEVVSYTELEFQTATAADAPRLVFLLEESCRPLGDLADMDRSAVDGFRQRLRDAGLVVRTFTSGDSLELEVFHALSELTGGISSAQPAVTSGGWRTEAGLTLRQLTVSGRPAPSHWHPGSAGRLDEAVPRVWNVPSRNAAFTGRDAILDRLHDELAGDGMAVVMTQAIYGLGGIGKTQVALEYAHRFKADYDLVWWIPAEQSQEISLALANLAAQLGFQASDNVAEAAAAALERMRCGDAGRWLLIFDNAEDPKDLEPFLPGGPGHVVITSRNPAWTRHAEPLELDVFDRKESVAHLRRHVPALSPGEAARVSAAVGDLPLAIEQAGAWLAETGMPPSLYVEWLETQAATALGLNKPSGYEAPVAATWNLSLNRLRDKSSAALRLLQILAFCSPEPISMTLLYSDAMNAALLPFDETLSDRFTLGRVIGSISRLALVKVDHVSNSLQIHRLVQAVIRSQMTADEIRIARHEIHKILADARPRQGETDDPANWSTYDLIWAHLGPSQAEQCDDPRTRELLLDWVRYQWRLGEFEASLSLARRLEGLWTRHLGPDHEQTLHLQFLIANVLRSQGLFSKARDLDTYVLERQRATLGAGHPHALMTAGSLGGDLRALGEFQQALTIARETYGSFKRQYGEDFPRTLAAAHNLATSLGQSGDFPAARLLDEETLQRQRQVLGASHPWTLGTATNLGRDMRETGALRESVELLRATYDRCRAVLGDDIPVTLHTGKSLAVSLRKAGALGEAMDLTQEIYDRCLKRYGPMSPDALAFALNLACDCSAHGDYSRARDLAAEVQAAYQSSLGGEHPSTLAAASNLVIYLRYTDELAHASHLAKRTLATMRGRLGHSHLLSLCCAVNLANCLADSGDLAQSEALERKNIAMLQDVAGRQHPNTLACEANLAVTLHCSGRDEEAEEVRSRILNAFSRVLGAYHQDVSSLREWRRIDCDLEPLPN
jgi:hypothetical protein